MKSKNQVGQSSELQIPEIIKSVEDIIKKARKNRHPLSGGSYYASKFLEARAEADLSFQRLSAKLKKYDDKIIKEALKEIKSSLDSFFAPKNAPRKRIDAKNTIFYLFKTVISPAMTIKQTHIPSDDLFPLEIVRDTRGYIEKIAEQSCGNYDQGWYDAAAVMIRRLLETLIIECFESHKIDRKIKHADGTFFHLRDLISAILKEKSWNIGRNAKKDLPKLKDIGDLSAHNRRFLAKKTDIDKNKSALRIIIEELVHLSKLKK